MEYMNMMSRYKDILYNLRLIYNKHKLLGEVKSDFNIFDLLLNPYDEVNLHSKMIYGILKEKKYGNEFLLSLLNIIGVSLPKNIKSEDISYVTVEREKTTLQGRLDIFISFIVNNEFYNIVIENKIWAVDQDKQMDRYIGFLNSLYNKENNYAFYLTLDGHEPSKDSCKHSEDIKLISYETHVLKWINSCVKIGAREPSLREVLVQYEELVEKITGKDSDYLMEVKDYILKDSDNFMFVNSLEKALAEAKVDLQLRFWKKLEAELEKHLKNEYNLEVENTIKDGSLGAVNPWYSENIIRNFYTTSRGNTNYGLLYSLGEIDNIGELFLKVEISRDSLYFGIRNKVNSINSTSKNYKNLFNKLNKLGYKTSDFEWWICWKYLSNNEEIINMTVMSDDLVRSLIDGKKFDKLIEDCVNQIDELIKLIYGIN